MKQKHKYGLGCLGIGLIVVIVGAINIDLLNDIRNDLVKLTLPGMAPQDLRLGVLNMGTVISYALRFSIAIAFVGLLVAVGIGWLTVNTVANGNQTAGGKDVATQQSIQALEQAKIEAETASHAQSDFLASMNHDLRAPLNHIIGFTELVADEHCGSLNDKQKEYLQDVLESSHHLLQLITDIVNIAKIDVSRTELKPSRIDLHALLKASLGMFREKAGKHKIALSLDAEEFSGAVWADEIKLKQIFHHLLSNAFDHTPDGGQIRIKIWPAHGSNGDRPPLSDQADRPDKIGAGGETMLAVSVSDTGSALCCDDQDRIFNTLEQTRDTGKSLPKGAGLKLTLVRRLVQQHGGRIWAANEGGRQGAIFQIRMPLRMEKTTT